MTKIIKNLYETTSLISICRVPQPDYWGLSGSEVYKQKEGKSWILFPPAHSLHSPPCPAPNIFVLVYLHAYNNSSSPAMHNYERRSFRPSPSKHKLELLKLYPFLCTDYRYYNTFLLTATPPRGL